MELEVDVRLHRGNFEVSAAFQAGSDETVALLGPNGSGKSSLIGALAGLQDIDSGRIALGDRTLNDSATGLCEPPERRMTGVVFQDLRLFPHMSALDNVAFALTAAGVGKSQARTRAAELLSRLGLDESRHRSRPADLSGGESQRVALARALICEPQLLLLDEPTASLDVQAKAAIRPLLGQILRSFGGARLLVTHDPVEAMTLAARTVVLEDGRVTQSGTPEELRSAPRTPYVAELVGVNLFRGRLERIEPGAGRFTTDDGELIVAWPQEAAGSMDDVIATLRPADVSLYVDPPERGSARNTFRGPIASIAVEGERARVRLESSPRLVAEVTLGSVRRMGLREGDVVWASFKAVEVDIRLPAGNLSL
jgi:molybdate transport system ATP-binding protein